MLNMDSNADMPFLKYVYVCVCSFASNHNREQKWGLNAYLYAPKDDYKHRMYWRDLYTPQEAGEDSLTLSEVISVSQCAILLAYIHTFCNYSRGSLLHLALWVLSFRMWRVSFSLFLV